MKKSLYIVLLAAESALGLLSLGMIYSWTGWPGFIIGLAVVAVPLRIICVKLKEQRAGGDAEGARKSRRNIALVLLIPTAAALIVLLYTLVSLFLYFG